MESDTGPSAAKVDRALEQWRDETLTKLLKRVESLEKEKQVTLARIDNVTSTVTQYSTVIDQLKAQAEKLPLDIAEELAKTQKGIAEATKTYIDQRFGIAAGQTTPQAQPAPGSPGTGATGNGLMERIGQQLEPRIGTWLDTAFNRILGGGPAQTPVDTELFNLQQQAETVFKAAYRNQLRGFVTNAAKDLGLPTPATAAGEVTHVVHKP